MHHPDLTPGVMAGLAWYFLLGPVLCLRQQDGVPRPSSWRLLVDETLYGWKDLLTTLPPVDGDAGDRERTEVEAARALEAPERVDPDADDRDVHAAAPDGANAYVITWLPSSSCLNGTTTSSSGRLSKPLLPTSARLSNWLFFAGSRTWR